MNEMNDAQPFREFQTRRATIEDISYTTETRTSTSEEVETKILKATVNIALDGSQVDEIEIEICGGAFYVNGDSFPGLCLTWEEVASLADGKLNVVDYDRHVNIQLENSTLSKKLHEANSRLEKLQQTVCELRQEMEALQEEDYSLEQRFHDTVTPGVPKTERISGLRNLDEYDTATIDEY